MNAEQYLASLKPYPPQEAFFIATCRRIAYGGARGGGKSFAMRNKMILLAMAHPGIQILLLRRTFPELRENHILPLRKVLGRMAKYTESTKEFAFKNGSRIKLGYCQNEGDILQYQGQSYEVVAMEEATQFTELQYHALTECCRLSGYLRDGFIPRMYFTCNPGGVGHNWVKRLFIDKNYRQGENPEDYCFIKSTVYDNVFMMENNPSYINNLESLPPLRRAAMLEGNWDVFEGQCFPEFCREKHMISPFAIPEDWVRFAALDYGLDMTACLWFAHPPDKSCLCVYRELYKPNLLLSEAGEQIASLCQGEDIRYIASSPDLAGRRQDSGRSGFDLLRGAGVRGLRAADNRRIDGWRRVREFLKSEKDKEKYIKIFSNVTHLARTLPALSFDQKAVEDVSLTPHELTHAPDAFRYGIMSLSFLPSGHSVEGERKHRRHNEYVNFFEK